MPNNIILESEERIKEQIIENTNDISKLKSNVKWIYQYGGVGGSGHGNGTEVDWSLNVTLDDKILLAETSKQEEIILDSDSDKNLVIQINKPNGKTFYIDYIKYYNGTSEQDLPLSSSARTLSPGKYKFEKSKLNIQGNGDFKIKVSCIEEGESDSKIINYFCITNPLSATVNYVVKHGSKYSKISTLNVDELESSDGLFIELNYTFYSRTGSLFYQILQSTLEIEDEEIGNRVKLTERTEKKYFKLNVDTNNLGYQMFTMNIIVDEDGVETPLFNSVSCTIIPNEMYLQVVPSNLKQIIYGAEQEVNDNTYKFVSGIHGFDLTPYSGSSQITSNKFNISCIKQEQDDINNIKLPVLSDFVVNNELDQTVNCLVENLSTNISERTKNTHQINLVLSNPDENVHLITLSFIMQYNNEFSKIEHFYIYVVKNKATINWYRDEVLEQSFQNVSLNYYRSGTCNGDFANYSKFLSSQYLQFRKTDIEQVLINLDNDTSASNVVVHIGLQYSEINIDDNPIITFVETNGNDIILYQNKIKVGSAAAKIYIPKEDNYNVLAKNQYHLISILKHHLYDNVCSITIYIDGVIENTIDTFYSLTDIFSFESIKTHKSNFSVNLLEVSYINDIKMFDNDISRYWDAFFDQYILNSTTDKTLIASIKADEVISEYIESLEFTTDNMVEIINDTSGKAETIINNISLSVDVPVLMLDYNNKIDDEYDKFVDWFTKGYEENDAIPEKLVGVYYSSGKSELGEKISTFTNTSFYIVPQGSSTLKNRSKNLDLGIKYTSTTSSSVPVYTPNFNLNDTNTFLPESKFTLKADQVDSSHSNNTAVGKFVNENTQKFVQASQDDANSAYAKHIKNCLLGFPVLVFVKVRINSPEQSDQPDVPENLKYYYLGVYNFNLGRSSYFNLGYYPLLHNRVEVFDDSLKTNDGKFGLYQISGDAIEFKSGLIVTEIQGGNWNFDFSQYDDTILFQNNVANKRYMFGDYVPDIYKYDDEGKMIISDDGVMSISDTGIRSKALIKNLVKNIAITGGLLFKELEKNFGPQIDRYNASVNNSDRIYDSINQVPDVRIQWLYNFNKDTDPQNQPMLPYDQIENESNIISNIINNSTPSTVISYLSKLIDNNMVDEHGNVTPPLLDYRSLVEYYVVCMAFGLVDSVQKNLNLKSWNATDNIATFYTAFYDMDTCLGRENGGAEVKYFAFSDYWKSVIENGKLSETTIYRDFYPVQNELTNVPYGYDVPSSYLFAIAKYARLSIPGQNFINQSYPSPNMIYAMWRNHTIGNNGKGSLQNAKYFVDTYFDTLKPVPTSLLNYNYRFKYLMINKNNNNYSFDTALNKKPFHGRGKYEVTEWLSNRLRLLDAYFNLGAVNTKIQKYDIENDNWSIVKYEHDESNNNDMILYEFTPTTEADETYRPDSNNDDIYVLFDIFGQSTKLGKSTDIIIQSNKWAPIVIKQAASQAQQFLVPEANTDFKINIMPNGTQTITLGGSQYWTYVNNLGAFVESTGITITSKHLTNINLNYLTSDTPTSWNFNTPSVEEIYLNNSNYGGTLKNTDNQGNDLLLNLNKVSLAGSSVSLDFKNNGFKELDITGTKSSEGIIISSCSNFNKLTYSSRTNISKLDISHIWNDNIVLSGFACSEIAIRSSNEKYNNASITIENITGLKTLNLTAGFKTIKIINCQELEKIVLPKDLENLIIKNVEFNVNLLSSQVPTDNFILNNNTIDISYLRSLKSISFDSCTGFTRILLPAETQIDSNDNPVVIGREIKLLHRAFAETYLEYIDFKDPDNPDANVKEGTLVLCDNEDHSDCSIFYNTRFNLSSPDEGANKTELKFKADDSNGGVSLSFIFAIAQSGQNVHEGKAQITYSKAAKFINELENKNNVISFDYAFQFQKTINAYYSGGEYYEYYDQANGIKINEGINPNTGEQFVGKIKFAGYNKLKSMQCMFDGTLLKFVDNNMFANMGITKNIDILNFIDYNVEYIHIDAFNPIKKYINRFLFDGKQGNSQRYAKRLQLYGYEGRYNNDIPLIHDFIFDNDQESHITELCGFDIQNASSNYQNLFTNNETNIESIHDVFTNLNQFTNGDNKTGYTKAYGLNNVGITLLSGLNTFYNAFICNLTDEITLLREEDLIDINNFINFNSPQYDLIQNSIPENLKNNSDYKTFDFYKKIYSEQDENGIETDSSEWKQIWQTLNITNINDLFSKCIVYTNNENFVLNMSDIGNFNNVKYARSLFRRSTVIYKDNNGEYTNIGFKLTSNTFSNFTGLENGGFMFANSYLDGRTSYPFTADVFNNTKLSVLNYMFGYTTIVGESKHSTYATGTPVNTFYKRDINAATTVNDGDTIIEYSVAQNYSLTSIEYANYMNAEYSGDKVAYPFIPIDLFSNLNNLSLEGMFAYSNFEGYLGSGMFTGKTIININDFVKGCRILPQQIADTNKYVLINSNFIGKTTETAIFFNFNIICSDSSAKIYVIVEDSLASNFKFSGFNLIIGGDSKLGNYLTTNANDAVVEKYINKNNLQINLYYNKESGQEGMPITFFNKITQGYSMCNGYLSTLISGPIVNNNETITANPNIKIVTCGYVSTLRSIKSYNLLSKNIILPAVEIYSTEQIDDILYEEKTRFTDTNGYYSIGGPTHPFKNEHAQEIPFIERGTDGGSVNIITSIINNALTNQNIINNYLLLLNNWSNGGGNVGTYADGMGGYGYTFTGSLYETVVLYKNEINPETEALTHSNNTLKFNKPNYTFYSAQKYYEGDGDTTKNRVKGGLYYVYDDNFNS